MSDLKPAGANRHPQSAREAFEELSRTNVTMQGVYDVLARHHDGSDDSTIAILRDLPPSEEIAGYAANYLARSISKSHPNDPVTAAYTLVSKAGTDVPPAVRQQLMFWTVIEAVLKSPVEALRAFARVVEAHGAEDASLNAAAEDLSFNYAMSPLPAEAAGKWKAAFDEWAHSETPAVRQLAFNANTANIARNEGFFGDFVSTAAALETAGDDMPMRFVAGYMERLNLDPAEHLAEGVLTPERKAELQKTYQQRAAAKARALEAGKARAMEQPPK